MESPARIPGAIGSGQVSDDFARANPRGEVPVLYVEGQAIFDSTVILEFIEDRFPDAPLLPAAPADRARVNGIVYIAGLAELVAGWLNHDVELSPDDLVTAAGDLFGVLTRRA